jgi:hypothetical protein
MNTSTSITPNKQSYLQALIIIILSILLIVVCYQSLIISWDYMVAQASEEINRWASQPFYN